MIVPMCEYCGWEQALTDIRMMISQDLHILDLARLERIKAGISRRSCVTPGQRAEILSLVSGEEPNDLD